MDIAVLYTVLVRVVIVYAALLAVVRLVGRRKVGASSAFDLVIAVLLADLAAQAVFGQVTLLHALLALAAVGVLHYASARLVYRHLRLRRLLAMDAVVVARDGALLPEVLAAERVPEEELWTLLRAQGIESLDEVKVAILEPSGHLSVVRQEWARPARKSDLQTLAEEEAA